MLVISISYLVLTEVELALNNVCVTAHFHAVYMRIIINLWYTATRGLNSLTPHTFDHALRPNSITQEFSKTSVFISPHNCIHGHVLSSKLNPKLVLSPISFSL